MLHTGPLVQLQTHTRQTHDRADTIYFDSVDMNMTRNLVKLEFVLNPIVV